MKSMNNVESAVKLFMVHDSEKKILSNTDFEIKPIKGYLTTNVYRLLLNYKNNKVIKYIKESSDNKNVKFNDFIKVEYINTKYVYDNFKKSNSISVVKPEIYFSDYEMFFMDEIQGDRLDNVILKFIAFRRYSKLLSIVKLSKQWLNEFQSINHGGIDRFSDFNFSESERAKIKHLHTRSIENCPSSDFDLIDKIFNDAYLLTDRIKFPKSDISLKHNDFAPWNVIIKNNLFTVYDFADMNIDLKYYDLMYFIHSLKKISAKVPFSDKAFELMKSEMLKDTKISDDIECYYTIYFYLQDIALLLTNIKTGGVKSLLYKYKYKVIINKITQCFDGAVLR